MSVAVLPYADEMPVTRRTLTSADDADPATATARAVVAASTTTLQLVVENADRGRTVDGWLNPDGLVWHVRGDLDTPRPALVTPAAHLAATVMRMVDLGPRALPSRDDVVVPLDVLRAQLSGRPGDLAGGVLRIWALSWSNIATENGVTLVDQGTQGGLWAVADAEAGQVRLHPVSPLEVWGRLATVAAALTRG